MRVDRCYFGDCRDVMRDLIQGGGRVQMCVTSPPYWGLRDYGVAGQLGLEATLEEYVTNMVEVFRLVRELLADEGTLWLNLGDSYAGSGRGGNPTEESSTLQGGQDSQRASMVKRGRGSQLSAGLHENARQAGNIGRAWAAPPAGLKQKDLVGIPWMLAFALRADGWYLRQDIIWHKPNPMPESVRDRCTKAHEYIFLLSKSEQYYYDYETISEPVSKNTHARLSQDIQNQIGSTRAHGGGKTNGNMKAVGRGTNRTPAGWATGTDRREHRNLKGNYTQERILASPGGGIKNNESINAALAIMPDKRNKRSVWTVTTQPYKGAHFATFPPKLIEPCILAGSRPGDIVFDPFFGSGTTGEVAQRLGRRWVGIELNQEYERLQHDRTIGPIGLPI